MEKVSHLNWSNLTENFQFKQHYFWMTMYIYVVSAGRVLSPVWTLESCDLETVSTRDG